jgi:hypothetical protein
MTQQRHARLGPDRCVQLIQKSHCTGFKESNGNAIAEKHAIGGDCRKLGARR